MRIDAGTHQRLDAHPVATDVLDHIRNDGGGANDSNRGRFEYRRTAAGTPYQTNSSKSSKKNAK
jgi:hypothetical protein